MPLGSCLDKQISPESKQNASEGDIFEIRLVFENLPRPSDFKCDSDTLSLIVKDSVILVPHMPAKIITEVPREYTEISYSI